MKKHIVVFSMVLPIMTGCSYYNIGTALGTALAYPVEAALDVTGGILDGFFYGDWDSFTDYKNDTYTPDPDPKITEEKSKTYKRDEHGNITW